MRFSHIKAQGVYGLEAVRSGDVVAIIGDFTPRSISTMLRLLDKGVIVVPLTAASSRDHDFLIDTSLANVVFDDGQLLSRTPQKSHPLIDSLRERGRSGIIFFTSGSTGKPKAILHDLQPFLARFLTPRPALCTLGFLLFDHMGGLNTLFHAMFNRGVVVSPQSRDVGDVLAACHRHGVEVLPATPTFLRLLLMSGHVPESIPTSLKVITYGTERMDPVTLGTLCRELPDVDFRQTYGMSEISVLRVKSEARDSLYMKVGGEGVETRIVDGQLEILSPSRMLGYLNAADPFDEHGWYKTGDIVEEKGEFVRIIGRAAETINVGGLKFMPSEVEHAALAVDGVRLAKAFGAANPVTGQHVELMVELTDGALADTRAIARQLKALLPRHMMPLRVTIGKVQVGHRFKKE